MFHLQKSSKHVNTPTILMSVSLEEPLVGYEAKVQAETDVFEHSCQCNVNRARFVGITSSLLLESGFGEGLSLAHVADHSLAEQKFSQYSAEWRSGRFVTFTHTTYQTTILTQYSAPGS